MACHGRANSARTQCARECTISSVQRALYANLSTRDGMWLEAGPQVLFFGQFGSSL